jgi:3' terminal RNA ribose 2'-O-methyltransferase Hen1
LVVALARDAGIARLIGTDVSMRELERAKARLERLTLAASQRERIDLFQSSALYADARLAGLDAVTLIEVIEHVDADRLPALVRSIFGEARPKTVVVTTPNREYNARFATLAVGTMRHPDHRFEWSRVEFSAWAEDVSRVHGYEVAFEAIGDMDVDLGPPTQMGIFTCA